jgi:hypothetical protein
VKFSWQSQKWAESTVTLAAAAFGADGLRSGGIVRGIGGSRGRAYLSLLDWDGAAPCRSNA